MRFSKGVEVKGFLCENNGVRPTHLLAFLISTMTLSKYHILELERGIRSYAFPCACYDFKKNCPLDMQDMKEVEEFISSDLRSGDAALVKNGLSNVLYWGFAQIGYRDNRVRTFRETVSKEKLNRAINLFKPHRTFVWVPPICCGRIIVFLTGMS
ncbi:hypothetical protein PITCH_A1110001 [uncultured Desulfobacterium sp.]|uniref:Uncharacterized protein n=1 Tax=uncultured Desulfobacterium sp. TaxID=201089 RepID=A0A445MR74_9BACT|nr:hypothetical protein PITCH_A1110001 [uncultured Desulfobacterium sp.]